VKGQNVIVLGDHELVESGERDRNGPAETSLINKNALANKNEARSEEQVRARKLALRREIEKQADFAKNVRLLDVAGSKMNFLAEQMQEELNDCLTQMTEQMRAEMEKYFTLMNLKLRSEFEHRFRNIAITLSQIAKLCEKTGSF
jgi:hypothetical protein